MRGKLTLLSGVIAAGAVVVSPAASTAAAKPKATKITCQSTVYYPTPTQPKGIAFAYENCPKPGAGVGVQSITYDATISSTGAVTAKLAFKNWFDTGTTHGTASFTGKFTSATTGTVKGPVTITGGTGADKAVRGKGTTSCSTNDGGAVYRCTTLLKLTGL